MEGCGARRGGGVWGSRWRRVPTRREHRRSGRRRPGDRCGPTGDRAVGQWRAQQRQGQDRRVTERSARGRQRGPVLSDTVRAAVEMTSPHAAPRRASAPQRSPGRRRASAPGGGSRDFQRRSPGTGTPRLAGAGAMWSVVERGGSGRQRTSARRRDGVRRGAARRRDAAMPGGTAVSPHRAVRSGDRPPHASPSAPPSCA